MITEKKAWFFFVGPGLAGLLMFYGIPFVSGLYYSLTTNGFQRNFVGLQNYIDLFRNSSFWLAFGNTMLFSGLLAPVVIALAFFCAVFLNNRVSRLPAIRSILLLPYVLPSVAIVAIWHVFFDYGGMVNTATYLLGLDRVQWMYGDRIRWVVITLYLWRNTGLFAIILLSSMQAIPAELYEVAELDGASKRQMHWYITLPLQSSMLFFLLVLSCANGMRIFKEAYFLGGAYPSDALYTLQHFMNNQFAKFNYSTITAAGFVLLLFMMLIVLLAYRLARRL